jgi:hypothetical protein
MPVELEVSPIISVFIQAESKSERDVFVATLAWCDKHVIETQPGD